MRDRVCAVATVKDSFLRKKVEMKWRGKKEDLAALGGGRGAVRPEPGALCARGSEPDEVGLNHLKFG